MKMTFRWYGSQMDPIPLRYIKQIPNMSGVVSSLMDMPAGALWPTERIRALKQEVNDAGLELEVIESVNIHEDIKLGLPSRDEYIDNYRQTVARLGQAGVKVICYNFMPVFDWLRSSLDYVNADGSTSLIYRDEAVLAMDPRAGDLSLPGWDASYTKEGLGKLLEEYKDIDDEALWANLKYFLEGIIPVCEEYDVKMAIHPDDPPWGIFGLPRIVTNEENLDRLLRLVDSPYNGLTLCTGSLGVNPKNDIPHMIRRFGGEGRIPFLHARNIKWTGERDFNETAHKTECGSLDMYEIIKAAHDVGFDGYIRPDHGRMIWGETGRPGYGLYDRALGAVYLNGLWEAIDRGNK